MTNKWNFPHNGFGQVRGVSDAGLETFTGTEIQSYAFFILAAYCSYPGMSDEGISYCSNSTPTVAFLPSTAASNEF